MIRVTCNVNGSLYAVPYVNWGFKLHVTNSYITKTICILVSYRKVVLLNLSQTNELQRLPVRWKEGGRGAEGDVLYPHTNYFFIAYCVFKIFHLFVSASIICMSL